MCSLAGFLDLSVWRPTAPTRDGAATDVMRENFARAAIVDKYLKLYQSVRGG